MELKMPNITAEQIEELIASVDTHEMTPDKCKEIMQVAGGPSVPPPPMLISQPIHAGAPPPPIMAPPAMGVTLTLESVEKLIFLASKMQAQEYKDNIPGAPKGLLGVVQENLNKNLLTLLKEKIITIENITQNPHLPHALSMALLTQKFLQDDNVLLEQIGIQLPALINKLANQTQLEQIEKKVRQHKNSAEGLTQLNILVNKLTEENASLAIQKELEKDDTIQPLLKEIDELKQQFITAHTALEDGLDSGEITNERDVIESHDTYKQLKTILEKRTQNDSNFRDAKRRIRTVQAHMEQSSQQQAIQRETLLQKIDALETSLDNLNLKLLNTAPEDKNLIAANQINLELVDAQLIELVHQMDELNQQETRNLETDEALIHEKRINKLEKLELKSQHYMLQQLEELKTTSARHELLLNRFNQPASDKAKHGIAKTGKLAIQIKLEDKDAPQASKKEQNSFVGLMMQAGLKQRPRLVVPDSVIESVLSTLKIEIIKESELAEWRQGNSSSTPSVCLEALSPVQLERLAAFCGSAVSMKFNPKQPDDVSDLYQILRTKLGRSSVTMSDVLLVALGYRYRSETFLRDFSQNKADGFLFSPDTVSNGNDFFALELTLKHEDGKKDDRVYSDAVIALDSSDGHVLAKLNAASHPSELDALYSEIDIEKEKLDIVRKALLDAVDGNEDHPDYKKSTLALEDIIQKIPIQHHQHKLCQFLLDNPDVYNPDIALKLSRLFTDAIINLNQAKSITSLMAKETTNIENTIDAIMRAKEAAEQEQLSVNDQERLLKEIRDDLKIGMLGSTEAAENGMQTEILDKMAQLQYEATYGKPQSAEDKIAGQQQNIQAEIGGIENQIANEKVRGTIEGLEQLQQNLADFTAQNAQLERELLALQQLQAQAPVKKEGARALDELEAENEVLKEQLAQAKVVSDGPKSLSEAYNRHGSIDELIDYARHSKSGKLDATLIFTQYVKPNIKGNQRKTKLAETKTKVSQYNNGL